MANKFLKPKTYINHLIYRLFLPKKSYSQAGEDMILDFFLKGKRNGFYADIGANHPKRFSNTMFFYRKGWRGINIEPDPKNFRRFIWSRRRDINLNIGVAEKPGELDFYAFKADTLSTFSEKSAGKYQAAGHKLVAVKKLKTMPLGAILDEYLPPSVKIDFFSIDTEGFDEAVLRSNDWNKYRPSFVVLETAESVGDGSQSAKKANFSGGAIDDFMKGAGYLKLADTYVNSIYVEKSFAAAEGINF